MHNCVDSKCFIECQSEIGKWAAKWVDFMVVGHGVIHLLMHHSLDEILKEISIPAHWSRNTWDSEALVLYML